MASNLPLPVPPRTPTPPADESAHQHAQLNSGVSVDRDSLSPLVESFPRSSSLETGTQGRLSPTKSSFNLSPLPDSTTSAQNGSSNMTAAGPFNFNTTVMAKSPVTKSVSDAIKRCHLAGNHVNICAWICRISGSAEVTSISTVVSRIRSSSSPLLERLWPCQTRSPFPH